MKQSSQSIAEEEPVHTEIRRRPPDLRLHVDWTKERRRVGVRANGGAAVMLGVALSIAVLSGAVIAAHHFGLL